MGGVTKCMMDFLPLSLDSSSFLTYTHQAFQFLPLSWKESYNNSQNRSRTWSLHAVCNQPVLQDIRDRQSKKGRDEIKGRRCKVKKKVAWVKERLKPVLRNIKLAQVRNITDAAVIQFQFMIQQSWQRDYLLSVKKNWLPYSWLNFPSLHKTPFTVATKPQWAISSSLLLQRHIKKLSERNKEHQHMVFS